MSARLAAAALAALAAACASVEPPPPQSAQVYADFLIGRIANARDDYGAASDRYFAALARSPGDEALVQGALQATLAAGDLDRARRAASMISAEEAPALARLVRAADALRTSNWRRADAALTEFEGTAVEEMLARTLNVWLRVGQGRTDEAVSELAPLTSFRPYGGLFLYQQAMAQDVAGRREAALSAYQSAAAGEMFLPPAIERHAEALARVGQNEGALHMLARLNEGRGNAALAALSARLSAGQAPAAAPLTPARAGAIGLYGFAAILLQQEYNADAGLVTLSLALMLDPDLDAARLMFAEAHGDAGRASVARETLGRIRGDSVYAQSARLMDARLLLNAGQVDEALGAARASAAGGDARAQRALADMYSSLDRYTEAEPIYSALLGEDAQNWRLYFARGAARERMGDWPAAEADLRQALELAPNQPQVLNYLGYTWVDRGENLDEGLAMIRRAMELEPNSAAITDSLGWAFFRLGDYRQAVMFLERAVELDPASAVLNDHLGDAYWRSDRRTEARFQWRRALTQDPDDPAALEAKIANGLAEPAAQ